MIPFLERFRSARSRCLPVCVISLTLIVLGTVIFLALHYFRARFREQIAGRDGRIIHALWLSQQQNGPVAEIPGGPVGDHADQFTALLRISRLFKGVLATRLLDRQGRLVVALPEDVTESPLTAEDSLQLSHLRPVSRFQPDADLARLSPLAFAAMPDQKCPLLEVSVPLHAEGQGGLLGIGQFVLEGKSLAAEFAALDENLARLGLVAFVAGGSIVVAVLWLAFRQLQKVNRALADRTQRLLQANQELALAAKTSAVGAVTSHLIHGLKNPLSGLQSFMANRASVPSDEHDTEWRLAASSARRMQNLVGEIVRVLREETGSAQYEVTLEELMEMVSQKTTPVARQAGILLRTRLAAQGSLNNRNANLVLLILENLIQNALEATPQGKSVTLEVGFADTNVVWSVSDQGSGLPQGSEKTVFTPCRSTKEGGSGIGLAISRQLALALGGELSLRSNSPEGCVFVLSMPIGLLQLQTA